MKRVHLGEFEELVLLMVAVLQSDAYSVAIRNEIQENVGRKAHISAVHTALTRLETKGFISSEMGEATATRGGRRKRLFKITVEGKSTLQYARQQRETIWNRVPEVVWG